MLTKGETAQSVSLICGNCGARTEAAYCPLCGQDTKRGPPAVAEYLREVLAHFVHLDGKLWRTFGTLLLLPGKLPDDYFANKRARYVKPLRLYLTTIAIAFAAVELLAWDLVSGSGGQAFL